ncbi:MAG: hypothetical protein KAS04_04900 [Candidatus Aenigmarchaeota archaeon]|nr:hypothetical protein [Candidatus Aenigmarchaeota archaeon]
MNMKLDDLTVNKVEEKITETDKGETTTHTVQLVKDDLKVTLTREETEFDLKQGAKGVSVEVKNTQKKL